MLQGFVLEMLKRKKAEILEISKRDGAVDSHEREIKCLGLSFSFNVNYASFLYKCHEVAEKGQSCKYERSNIWGTYVGMHSPHLCDMQRIWKHSELEKKVENSLILDTL